jgi:hypothetical protein
MIQIFETIYFFVKQGCNMIQIFESLGLVLSQTCYFGPGKYDTFFPLMNKYLLSLNLYHPSLWQE